MPRNKKKKTSNKLSDLTQRILKFLRKSPGKTFDHKEIAEHLNVDDAKSRNQIVKELNKLSEKKKVVQPNKGEFVVKDSKHYHTGILDVASRGGGYVMVEGLEEDIHISEKKLNHALHGDEVKLYIHKQRRSKKHEGEIVEIIKRKTDEFIGVIQILDNFAFVNTSAEGKMYTDVFVPKSNYNGAKNGEKVLVKLEEWEEKRDSPTGKVIKILGMPGEHNTEIHAILAQYGLPSDFPEEVDDFANKIDTSIQASEIKKRRDMRRDLTFTIDPKDAKDFDDALSFTILPNGNYEVGIHIADVSHYLTPGTILDDEAYERATSVYLVDRVVPMLPEILSNNACSLRPHEEKYTFSAVFEVDKETAKVHKEWFGRTVTYSDARFAYEEAQQIIETGKGFIPADISINGKEYSADDKVVEATLELNKLAKIMRRQRMKNGAISFDKVEVKFNLDEDNEPVGVFFKTAKDANKLIEEFMLLANRKVAEYIGKQSQKKTFVYRIHDEPNEEKLAALGTIAGKFGYKTNFKDRKSTANSLNGLLENVQGKKEQNLIDTLTIRTMSKAVYSTENIGHYGLAFDYYTHFTSPIRRYPDVMVHRLLQRYLDGGKSASEDEYDAKCKHSSDMEYLATSAERDSIKYMQVKFMQDHKNEIFLGVISGVTTWGIFVEIVENKCEGMIRVRDIEGDYYEFDQEQYAVVGRKTKKVLTLGDEIYVRVKEADLVKKNLDFTLVGKQEEVDDV
ncbi:ribonuclease R [Flavimarina sp. Hel_I_48]|uniref:ribonuclease R n=1 Tax=Flavimarina sp. Hel_I_48 TaxID=1392488 RepID=UPI0004DEE34F|nr:ribonuclease R [Flavimarina sp. Hel_I_48]